MRKSHFLKSTFIHVLLHSYRNYWGKCVLYPVMCEDKSTQIDLFWVNSMTCIKLTGKMIFWYCYFMHTYLCLCTAKSKIVCFRFFLYWYKIVYVTFYSKCMHKNNLVCILFKARKLCQQTRLLWILELETHNFQCFKIKYAKKWNILNIVTTFIL